MPKQIFIILTIVFFYNYCSAQTIAYHIQFEGIADNREFFSPYADAETILGSRIMGTVANIQGDHKLEGGFSYFYEHGSELLELTPQMILFYSFSNNAVDFKFGSFPMKETIDFPITLLSERYEYYNPVMDGLFLQYKGNYNQMGVAVDWVSRVDTIRREQFWVGAFGTQKISRFFFEEYFFMFHNAHRFNRLPGDHIEDNLGIQITAGYNFSDLVPLDVFSVKTGLLTSAFRNRGDGSDFNIGNSSYSEILADYKGYGVELLMKMGSEHVLLYGDSFMRNAKNYWRTKFYLTPIKHKNIEAQLSWSIHMANGDLDNQQQFRLIYKL